MSRIRYGVVGLRGIGSQHCRFAGRNPKVELVAVADVDRRLSYEVAAQFGAKAFTDYREMIREARLDAVSIAVPNHLHHSIAIECMELGVHVFLEKPIALTLEDADRVIETARATGRKLCISYQYRLFRVHRTIKELIESDAIGKLRRILWTWTQLRTTGYFDHFDWRRKWPVAGGGVLMHNLSHDLNVLSWLAGPVAEVTGLALNQIQETDTEDMFSGSILFRSGAIATLQATLNQPQAHVVRQLAGDKGMISIQEAASVVFDYKDHVMLGSFSAPVGELRSKLSKSVKQPSVSWKNVPLRGDPPKWKKLLERFGLVPDLKPNCLAVLLDSFADSIQGDGEPIVTGEDGRDTLELVNAFYLSIFRKKTVVLPVDREEDREMHQSWVTGSSTLERVPRG